MKNNEKYKSLLVIVIGLLVLFFVFKSQYFLFASVSIGVLSLISPILADLILKIWFKIAEVLGYINTRIILSAVFFVFLTPFALLQRIVSRKNYLSLKDSEKTLFHTRNHTYLPEDFDNIW